jgi:hypothetical protein
MDRFLQVKGILDSSVGGPAAIVPGPHGAFWRPQTRDQFVQFSVFGLPLVTLGDGDGSTIVKALRGEEPFGQDTGTKGASFRRMPAGRDPMPPADIEVIARWIDDDCPETGAEVGPLEITLNGAADGAGFVIVSSAARPRPAVLTLRTTDGSTGEVTLRVSPAGAGDLTFSPATVPVSGTPAEVEVLAATPSAARNDTAIEVLEGTRVLARFTLTTIETPSVRFTGRFQCRLATDPDPFDHPWGEKSSFGVYAVEGPDPAHPDEPPLDRIIRFHAPVAPRPFSPPVGVTVTGIEAQVGGARVRFTEGDPLIGQPVRLGPDCVFDSRNRTFAPDGFEPIANFRLEVGEVFAGASAPAVPRKSPAEPPGSTAPYADGVFGMDGDPRAWPPSEFGFGEATWAERSWAVVARKLARLVAQRPPDARAARIRDRRIKEHAVDRLGSINFPIRLVERYTGLIDRELRFAGEARGVLAELAALPAIRFHGEFFDFDTDCQIGTVTGTLGTPAISADVLTAEASPATAPLRREPPDDPG